MFAEEHPPGDELDGDLTRDVRILRAVLAGEDYESASEEEVASSTAQPQEVPPGKAARPHSR